MVPLIRGLQQHDAVLGRELLGDRVERTSRPRPSSSPIPAITHMPCGSMKICPSSYVAEPTGPPK